MGFIIGLNIVLAGLGYLLPLPSMILAWRELLRVKRVPPLKAWRRLMSHIGIFFLSLGLVLWTYAIVREALLHDYSYIVASAIVGRWGSLASIFVCAFAESKIRRYLLIGLAGLLFFFGAGIGDIAI